MLIARTLLITTTIASAASAQIIYQPTTVQHDVGGNTYYYAGDDARIHASATFPSIPGANFGRGEGFAFRSSTRSVVERNSRIFTDAFGGYDVSKWGMTPDDVTNEAHARMPLYFRKEELLVSGTMPGGSLRIVAPTAPGTISIRPTHPQTAPPSRLNSGWRLVIPRDMMDRKVSDVTRLSPRV